MVNLSAQEHVHVALRTLHLGAANYFEKRIEVFKELNQEFERMAAEIKKFPPVIGPEEICNAKSKSGCESNVELVDFRLAAVVAKVHTEIIDKSIRHVVDPSM